MKEIIVKWFNKLLENKKNLYQNESFINGMKYLHTFFAMNEYLTETYPYYYNLQKLLAIQDMEDIVKQELLLAF